jgi:hypothetical protein
MQSNPFLIDKIAVVEIIMLANTTGSETKYFWQIRSSIYAADCC